MKYINHRATNPKENLSKLVQEAGDVFNVAQAAAILKLNKTAAAKRLARWTEQGWLRRVAQGVYVPAGIDTLFCDQVISDPWVLPPALFAPCYIGGRTAAEYWDLTEQIFNDIVVMTTQQVRKKRPSHQGVTFSLKHIKDCKLFGTRTIWRENSQVLISDPHKTMIDMLDDPAIGGGIQHVADCLKIYLDRPDRCDDLLMDYAKRLNNGAVFKRLGFLLESETGTGSLQTLCAQRLTQGNAKLDPGIAHGKIVSRWHLVVPQTWLC